MAHLTQEQIDQAAAEPAAATDTPAAPAYVTLAYGAEGPKLEQLVNLLRLLGYHTSDVAQGISHKLDESVLNDVRAFQAEHQVTEPAVDVQGELVGPATWTALYAAAEAKLAEGDQPAA